MIVDASLNTANHVDTTLRSIHIQKTHPYVPKVITVMKIKALKAID